MHGNPRIPDLSIIGHHRSIFLLPGKVSIVTEASGPACKRQVAHTLGQLQMVLGFWITFWVTHIQSARKKTNWTVTNNRLYWFGVLFVHCFLEPFPHASSWAHYQFEWAMCDGGSPWVFISTLFFFFLLLYSKNPTLFMQILHTLYVFFRVSVSLEISDLHDLDTVLCCLITPKVSFSYF